MTGDQNALRVAFVPGVTLRKWTHSWAERHPETALEVTQVDDAVCVSMVREGLADCGFVRLPIGRDNLSVIRLYGEVPMLVVPRDHELAELGAVTTDQLGRLDGVFDFPQDSPIKDAVQLVAAGVGFLRLPHSLARLHGRKDVAAIPIDGADETEIALVWLAANTTPLIEEFIGIVRGRTVSSSRGPGAHEAPKLGTTRVVDRRQPRTQGSRTRNRKGRAR